MRCPFTRLTVGLVTFLAGVGLSSVWVTRRAVRPVETYVVITRPADPYATATAHAPLPKTSVESPEEKAVRLAEEFVARNGYTDAPPDRDALSHETVEYAESVDQLLKFRHDTLEPKAYGIFYRGRSETRGGWTVAFRYKTPSRNLGREEARFLSERGRVVTMDKNFENLRVEHKDIFLARVDRKL